MADVDTSSYPKPVPLKSAVEQIKDIGGLQQQKQQIDSNALTIDKQKLDLVNQRFGYLAKSLTQLSDDPELSEDKIRNTATNMVKLGYIPADMAGQFISTLPPTQGMDPKQASGVLQHATKGAIYQAQEMQAAINSHYGNVAQQGDNANVYTGIQKAPIEGGNFVPKTVTPQQLPPTAPTVNNNPNSPDYLQPGYVGPAGPAGPRSLSSNVAAPPAGMVNDPSQGNLTGSAPVAQQPTSNLKHMVTGPTGPTVQRVDLEGTEPAKNFNDRFGASFPNRVATGAAPGVAAAIQTVGEQSGKDYASSLTRARNFQSDLYPAEAALEGIKKLGPQGVGPGTDALNNIKSAIITWLPNAKKEDIDNVGNFEATRKYLTQIARSSGNTGTNDQLAAAFEGNPSIKLSQAATETVLKSVIALRKMEHAQTLLFGEQGLPPNQYSQWVSKNQNVFDPRAFGFVDMDRKAQDKVIKSLTPAQKKKFEYSLEFANKAGLIEPPKLK